MDSYKNQTTTPVEPVTTDLRTPALTARTTANATRAAWAAHARVCRIGQTLLCVECELLGTAFSSAAAAARAAYEAYAPAGSTVTYHGTKTQHHGPGWTVCGVTHCSCGTAYTIVRNTGHAQDDVLSGVHIEWITPSQDDVRRTDRRSRADALADGTLIDVPQALRAEIGFPLVAFTVAAWADTVTWTDEDTTRTGIPQNEDDRLLDVLAMARTVVRTVRHDKPVVFSLSRYPRSGIDGFDFEASKALLRLSLEDGPAFTISLLGED
ncbi:hypothetical protein [Streptosporangium sp. NPDC006930]|uniref:hypothetical protein n=1 Tax=Streptosporangium sp. NPDC006930 TaxID=3154783 RepID=UPI00344276EF